MGKEYLNRNVYEVGQERIAWLFEEFDNVLVSFSGGKDSTVCLNLCYDHAKENGLLDRLAMYHLDYEAQYQMTTDFVTDTFETFEGIRRYWLCLPIEAQCACRMDGAFWTPWAKESRDIWVRDMPDSPHLIHEDNVPFDFGRGMTDKEVQTAFGRWFASQNGSTAVVIGIRADESQDRYKLVTARTGALGMHRCKGRNWTVENEYFTQTYPMYDWRVEDVWTYLGRFDKAYNRLYDLYHQAGMSVNQMRVASPFNNCAMDTLKLYKAIDPKNWGKMTGRVNGVNFAGLYGGTTAMGWKKVTLPEGHTWKSYCYFLLSTLDEPLRSHYERILATSLEYWCVKGGFVAEDIMDELDALKTDIEDLGRSPRYRDQRIVRFAQYPDDADTRSFAKLPSYKRMCVCILKNDYYCQYMGFGKTKEAIEKRKRTLERYRNL